MTEGLNPNQSTNATSKHKRPRWLQIGLRTLLVVFTALIFVAAYLRVYLREWEVRDAIRERIEEAGGSYEAKAGPSWVAFLLGKDECPVLTSVSFRDPNLPPRPPVPQGPLAEDLLRALGQLPSLEQIDVPHQLVTDEILQSWSELSQLKKLTLKGTLVEHPQSWPDWPLEELNVAVTPMEEADLIALAKYTSLRALNVNDTGFGDQELLAFKDLPHLQTIDATHTRVTLSSRDLLNSFPKLQRFSQLSWLPSDSRFDPNLRSLQFGNLKTWNSLGSVDEFNATIRERLRNISSETLEHNTGRYEYVPGGIEWTQIDALGHRDDARQISAYSAYFDDESLSHLDQFPNLGILRLSDAWITDDGLRHLRHCPKLTSLSLVNTRISDEGLKHLLGCQNLDSLDLSGTRVTSKGIETLAKLPGLVSLTLPPAAFGGEEILLLTKMPNLRSVDIHRAGRWDLASHGGERLDVDALERIRKVELHFIAQRMEHPLDPRPRSPYAHSRYTFGDSRAIYTLLRLTPAAKDRLLQMVIGVSRSELQ